MQQLSKGKKLLLNKTFFAKLARSSSRANSRCVLCPRLRPRLFLAYALGMQQHIASKRHKERQLEWEALLFETYGDAGDVRVAGEEGGGDGSFASSPPVLHDSDEEFEAQLAQMRLGGDKDRGISDKEWSDGDSSAARLVGPSAVAAAESGSDEEEEASLNFGKKKKKKKVKRGVMSDAALLEAVVAADIDLIDPDDRSDEKECDSSAHGKKMTKKQIRRFVFLHLCHTH
jgi:hypothetical protein